MADRGPVKIRTGRIDDLIDLYKSSYKKLSEEIVTATESGKIQKVRVMARINAELTSLGVDVNEWVKREIPQYYMDGANQAIQDLKALGVDVSKPSGMAAINRQAIAALLDDVSLSFAESIRTLSRNSRKLLTDVQRQQINLTIAKGRLEGADLKAIVSGVKDTLKQDGLGVLVDKAGRTWTFDNYADMLVKTKIVEARNQGLANRMLQNGYDLVQISTHASKHEACRVWEGKILSISGSTPEGTELPGGFVVSGTLEQAKIAGLFHPRCQHAANVIVPELAAKTKAYDNPYNYQ